MADPIKLIRPEVTPNPEMIAALEELLADAKSGKVAAVAIAQENADGSSATSILATSGIGSSNWFPLCFYVEVLRQRLLRRAAQHYENKPFGEP